MLENCLYCGRSFSHYRDFGEFGHGVRIAYDRVRGRIWSVCGGCHGWNLWDPDERGEALEQLERAAADRGRLLWQTDNVALLELDGRELIRIGKTKLREEAWWRYGRSLRERYEGYGGRFSMLGAASYAAVSHVGLGLGLSRLTGDFRYETDVYAGVMRWRRFGETAWSGRAACPRCQSVLLKLFFFRSRSLILLPDEDGTLMVGLPCSRCDPWTVDKIHRFDHENSERILRRVLAYRNIDGASDADLAGACQVIDAAGSAQELVRSMANQRVPLFRLDRTRTLALEISINHSAERRQLAREVQGLEAAWRQAEEIAAIIDEELR